MCLIATVPVTDVKPLCKNGTVLSSGSVQVTFVTPLHISARSQHLQAQVLHVNS